MNTTEEMKLSLEKQSRAAVIAYLQDSSVRLEGSEIENIEWHEVTEGFFNFKRYYYRIAQPKPWYRVALFDFGPEIIADKRKEIESPKWNNFIKWLTDRVEYSNEDNKSIED